MSVNLTSTHPGVTSRAFHISLWILLCSGLIGNVLVIIWRSCRRAGSSRQLQSLLIISLAAADLLFCCQFLLRELILLEPIFIAAENETFSFTATDERMCLATTFFTFVSCNTVLLTSLAIAMHSFLSLTGFRHRKVFISIFVSLGWVMTVVLAAVTTWYLKWHDRDRLLDSVGVSVNFFTLIVMFGCTGDLNAIIFPVVVTSVNALSSVLCTVLYVCVCVRIRQALRIVTHGNSSGDRTGNFPIRLAIIVLLNIVCWWPACILYWFSYIRNETVFNHRMSPETIEPIFLFAAAVSACNPVMYSVPWKPVSKLVRRFYDCFRCGADEEKIRLFSDNTKNQYVCSAMCGCNFAFRSRTLSSVESSDITQDTRLFTETVE